MSTSPVPGRVVRFYFDFLSPFAYLAQHELALMAQRHGWRTEFRSIELGKAKQAIGNIGPGNRDMPVKLAYLKRDLARWAELYGITLVFPPNYASERLNAGLYFPACQGHEGRYVAAAYALVWGQGKAPDAPEVLHAVARSMGWDPDEFMRWTDSQAGRDALARSTQEAIDRRVFGVPTMLVDDEMWWGNDRLFMLEQHLTKETNR